MDYVSGAVSANQWTISTIAPDTRDPQHLESPGGGHNRLQGEPGGVQRGFRRHGAGHTLWDNRHSILWVLIPHCPITGDRWFLGQDFGRLFCRLPAARWFPASGPDNVGNQHCTHEGHQQGEGKLQLRVRYRPSWPSLGPPPPSPTENPRVIPTDMRVNSLVLMAPGLFLAPSKLANRRNLKIPATLIFCYWGLAWPGYLNHQFALPNLYQCSGQAGGNWVQARPSKPAVQSKDTRF